MSRDDEILDELRSGFKTEEEAFSKPIEFRKQKALQLQAKGVRPCVSTSIDGSLTYGYGMLDSNGFWEYPL